MLLLLLTLIGKVNSESCSFLQWFDYTHHFIPCTFPLPSKHRPPPSLSLRSLLCQLPFLSSVFLILCQILVYLRKGIRNCKSKITCIIESFGMKDFCIYIFFTLMFSMTPIRSLQDRIITYISSSLKLIGKIPFKKWQLKK